MKRRHQRILEAIYAEPTHANLGWQDIESLLIALGAELSEGSGSRLRVALHGVRAVFHRPHPAKVASKAMVRSVRRFLSEAGERP